MKTNIYSTNQERMSSNKFWGENTASFKLKRGHLNSESLAQHTVSREPAKQVLWSCALSTWDFNRRELITCSLCSLGRSVGFLEINHWVAYWPLCKPVVPLESWPAKTDLFQLSWAPQGDLTSTLHDKKLVWQKQNKTKIKSRDFLPQAVVLTVSQWLCLSSLCGFTATGRESHSSSRINEHTKVNPRLFVSFFKLQNTALLFFSPDLVQNRIQLCQFVCLCKVAFCSVRINAH